MKASDTLEHQSTVWPVPWLGLTRPKQLSMAATARVTWLCACVRYWPNFRLVFECVTCFYCCLTKFTPKINFEKHLTMRRCVTRKAIVLACVAAVSFPFPNACGKLPNFLAHPRRAPSLAHFSFACSISAPPEKGKESAATQATIVCMSSHAVQNLRWLETAVQNFSGIFYYDWWILPPIFSWLYNNEAEGKMGVGVWTSPFPPFNGPYAAGVTWPQFS